MILRGLRVYLAIGAFFALAYPASADACTPPIPGLISGRQVIPHDGQTGVPTNVQIAVTYSASGTVTDHLKLQSSDGVPVATTASQAGFLLTPVASLEPNTQYQLLSDLAVVPCEQDPRYLSATSLPACTSAEASGVVDGGVAIDGGTSAPPSVIATFTTGNGPDVSPPVLNGNVGVTTSYQSCSGGGCCVEFTGVAFTLGWPAATDDTGIAHYEIANQTGSGSATTFATSAAGLAFCTGYGPGLGFQTFIGTAGTYQVVAVDLAGNRSVPVNAVVSIDCSVPDAGQDSSPGRDTGLPADTTRPSQDADLSKVDIANGEDAGTDVITFLVDATTESDAGLDLGAPKADAAADVGTGAGDLTPKVDAATASDKTSGGGCSCRLGNGRRGSASALVVVLGLLLIHRRGRRARCSAAGRRG